VKAWIVGSMTAALVVASGLGLWLARDDTRTSGSQSMGRPIGTSAGGEEIRGLAADGRMGISTAYAPPRCTDGDDPVEADPLDDWQRVVVDPGHRLRHDFAPPDLVDVSAAGFETTGDTVRQIVVPDLAALRRAAEAHGTPFIIVSAFRSYEYQQRLFDEQVDEVGEAQAEASTAVPGHSEHQLGTTIDVLDPQAAELTTAFARTPAGRWLAAHAHEYGFVMSYPDEAPERTCYEFEPWHLRYVGRDIAQRIHESGRTPREWMVSHSRDLR
jgi:D-alanyl-D-alanine carboxypeptidase